MPSRTFSSASDPLGSPEDPSRPIAREGWGGEREASVPGEQELGAQEKKSNPSQWGAREGG